MGYALRYTNTLRYGCTYWDIHTEKICHKFSYTNKF